MGRWGNTFTQVVLAPYQFSSFNSTDPNVTKYPRPEDPAWVESVQVINDDDPDVTDGAQFYFNPSIVRPKWAESMELKGKFGNHEFYRENI